MKFVKINDIWINRDMIHSLVPNDEASADPNLVNITIYTFGGEVRRCFGTELMPKAERDKLLEDLARSLNYA